MGLEWWVGAVVGWFLTGWTVGGLIDTFIVNSITGKKVLAGYRSFQAGYNPHL